MSKNKKKTKAQIKKEYEKIKKEYISMRAEELKESLEYGNDVEFLIKDSNECWDKTLINIDVRHCHDKILVYAKLQGEDSK